ncbi:hypothetical protein QWY87_09070 [Lutimonas halocynthiae]|uniref:hypothetical protein n=1 Tax=Lutimonas halocynthiae TaxID=1446477 RepID=UPI0025B2C8FB|nr:hypothetical protein [Lutimonas halocynthiae]MDN3642848.1 hypothetical protein [Lutimonas halocynthiae]
MKALSYLTFGVLLLSMGFSCGEDADPIIITPGKASLTFPENNKDCNEGSIVSDTESEVTFRWTASANADSYTLQITNMDSGSKQSINSNSTEAKVSILRATPFSWMVIAKNNSSSVTTQSDTWAFYNAGPPGENHVPYPATVVSPGLGSEVNEGTVSLEWSGSDLDNDIASYEVYMDQVNPPTTMVGTSSTNKLDVSVSKDIQYFWQVISIDAIGNKSTSEVFNFSGKEGVPVEPSANLVQDGEMNDTGKWSYKQLWTGSGQDVEHGFDNGEFKFIGTAEVQQTNAIIWQEIAVEKGKTYKFSAKIRSEGSTSSWLEVYFGKQSVEAAGDDYTDGGAEVFVKSFGDNENCGVDAYNGEILEVASGGCPLPEDSLLDANGNVTFSEGDLTSNGTIFLAIKAGNWDGNFGTGIFVDNVVLKEVE